MLCQENCLPFEYPLRAKIGGFQDLISVVVRQKPTFIWLVLQLLCQGQSTLIDCTWQFSFVWQEEPTGDKIIMQHDIQDAQQVADDVTKQGTEQDNSSS